MSKLAAVFRSFLGDAESAVSIVADALASAVKVAAQHGTQAPLFEALAMVSELKGVSRRVVALRDGIAATGLSIGADKRVSIPGATLGATPAAQASAIAAEVASAFTVTASVQMTAKLEKVSRSDDEKALAALKVLAGIGDAAILRALSSEHGQTALANIIRAQAVANAAAAAARADAAAAKAMRKAPAAASAASNEAPIEALAA